MTGVQRRVKHSHILLTFGWLGALAFPVYAQAPERPLVNQYCVSCHSQKARAGGLVLEGEDPAKAAEHPEIWEEVIRKLERGAMPPQGVPRPDQAEVDRFLAQIEGALDRAAIAKPNPGRPVLNRMNRTVYANAIHDLLNFDVDVATLLPPDDSSFGFDNVGSVLSVSPALLERYLGAASKISRLAVGDPTIGPVIETYRVRPDLSQDSYIEGMPLGTRGGVTIRHYFPLDAEYVIHVGLLKTTIYALFGTNAKDEQLEITLNGTRLGLFPISAKTADSIEVRVPVKAGPQMVGVDFLRNSVAPSEAILQPILRSTFDITDPTGLPHVSTVSINGPYKVTGSGDTPTRRRIFICHPANGADELPCAKRILSTLVRHAYRRPANDKDMESLLGFYQSGRNEGTFETGIERALQRILSDPQFVFRFERDPANVPPRTPYRISDLELATRLAFFLWSTLPDDELIDVAGQGKLKDPAMLDRQVRRMLADPRSESLVTNFGGQWLYLRNLPSLVPNPELFADFDDNLRQAFLTETQMLFDSIIRQDRSLFDLLNADYTFVNERLAKHYGIPDVYGTRFRKVTLTDDNRRGLLGQGSILMVTSVALRTSPVARGKFLLENIIGMPPNPPPANVPPLTENAAGNKPLSVRERMEEHRKNAVCAGCHRTLDPLGFALENFDAVGRWRDRSESGEPIDASGILYDGTKVNGPASLRQAILSRPAVFAGTLTEKLMTFALGRGLDAYDMPAVRGVVREAAKNDYRFSSLILGIVRSTPFRMRMSQEREQAGPVARLSSQGRLPKEGSGQ